LVALICIFMVGILAHSVVAVPALILGVPDVPLWFSCKPQYRPSILDEIADVTAEHFVSESAERCGGFPARYSLYIVVYVSDACNL